MAYIILGVFGFLLAILYDPVSMRGIRWGKPVIGVASLSLMLYSLAMVSIQGEKFSLPPFTLPLGWSLFVVSSFLLTYSVFLEIPFASTYARAGVGNRLVTSGTYALVRHPGVLWLVLLLLSLLLVSRSELLMVAAPIYIVLDIVWVTLQDRVFFPRMFPGYEEYRRRTPFLIPNLRSVAACLRSIQSQIKEGRRKASPALSK